MSAVAMGASLSVSSWRLAFTSSVNTEQTAHRSLLRRQTEKPQTHVVTTGSGEGGVKVLLWAARARPHRLRKTATRLAVGCTHAAQTLRSLSNVAWFVAGLRLSSIRKGAARLSTAL